MTFLQQSYVIMPGGCLPESKNETVCQILVLKEVAVTKISEKWSLTREFLKRYLTEKENGDLQSGHLWGGRLEKWSL